MKTRWMTFQVLVGAAIALATSLPAQASERVRGQFEGRYVDKGVWDPAIGNFRPVIRSRPIKFSVEIDNDWRLQCGTYAMTYFQQRLGSYDVYEQARILGMIQEIEIEEVSGGPFGWLIGTPDPGVEYNAKKQKLVIEFDRDSSRTGLEYCRFGAIRTLYAQMERWSGRLDPAPNPPASNVSPAVVQPQVVPPPQPSGPSQAEINGAIRDSLVSSMSGVLAPLPANGVPCP